MTHEKDHILIVEDSEITLYKVKAVLIRLGYDVTAFDNPIKAMEWIKTVIEVPDLIISDVSMPGMDGYEFIHQLKNDEKTKDIPIILLTSHVDIRDKIQGLEAGADDYLGKTVGVAELELRVKALLARKHADDSTITEISARSISVFSLRGGVGVSSIAVNLAEAISKLWGIETCLWDMAMGVGQCALMMNLKPVSTIASISDWAEATLDDSTLSNMLLRHSSGVLLMPAPVSIEELELVTTRTIDLVWSGVASLAPYLVIDNGSHLTDQTLAILERSDIILLVISPDLASVNAAYQAIKVFNDIGFPPGKVQVILNQISPVASFTREQISESLKKSILVEIPYDGKNMIKAINQGTPYLEIAPKSDTSMAIAALAYKISSSQMEPKMADHSEPTLDLIRKQLRGKLS
jgi:pilus assembly protein CpaE